MLTWLHRNNLPTAVPHPQVTAGKDVTLDSKPEIERKRRIGNRIGPGRRAYAPSGVRSINLAEAAGFHLDRRAGRIGSRLLERRRGGARLWAFRHGCSSRAYR
jgi:hypothetical protein